MGINPDSWGPTDQYAPAWALEFVDWYCTPPELRLVGTASAFAEEHGVAKSRLSELMRTVWFEARVKAHKAYNGFSYADLAMVKDVVLKRALAGDVNAAQTVLINQPLQPTAGDQAPADMVQPDELATLIQSEEWVHKSLCLACDSNCRLRATPLEPNGLPLWIAASSTHPADIQNETARFQNERDSFAELLMGADGSGASLALG